MSERAEGWQAAHDFAERLLGASLGKPSSASRPALHPTRDVVAATIEVRESMTGRAGSQVGLISAGETTLVRKGYSPAWSPDGEQLAHLDELSVWIGDQQHSLPGAPERLAWSPDGASLLVLIAEPGSELSNLAGSGLLAAPDEADAWLPTVESSLRHVSWRRLLVIDAATGAQSLAHRNDLNVWDACWAGGEILAVCSDGSPTESAWYTADLRLLEPLTGTDRVIHASQVQYGPIAASPSGRHIAYVEAICSDRDIVAGDLWVHDLQTDGARRVLEEVDVSAVEVLDDEQLGFAGLRGLVTHIGRASLEGQVETVWQSEKLSTVGAQPFASFRPGRTAFVRAGFCLPPEVVLLGADEQVLVSYEHEGAAVVKDAAAEIRVHRWKAPDGQEIEGWLHLPPGPGPYPLVMWVHGGPMGAHRSGWSGAGFSRTYLLAHGYAVLQPNPRGSVGRGQDFATAVVGDMGGADSLDLVSGAQSLIDAGVADPARIGVTGGSYGGYMSSWLVTQTEMFAAAVPQFPITDWGIQHGVSSIPDWDELFLDGKPYALDGQYVDRSPLAHASKVRTPTLFIAGGRDRATPYGHALSMHRAIASFGTATECVVYPHEGHGTQELPATIDVIARTLAWFQRWMPAQQA